MRRRRGINPGVSYTNCALLVATGLLVLISVHAKSPRPSGSNGDQAGATLPVASADAAAPSAQRPDHDDLQQLAGQSKEDVGSDEDARAMHHHRRRLFDEYLGTIRRLRRPYRSKYTIEELMRLQVSPKVSGDIDMDPCKAGEYGHKDVWDTFRGSRKWVRFCRASALI